MEYITILNNSLESISFYVYFYKDENLKDLVGIKTPFFGNNDFQMVSIPENSIKIVISLRIKTSNGSMAYISSIKLDKAVSKTYQFLILEEKPNLFEINPAHIISNNYIFVKNKSSNKIKGDLSFNIERETVTQLSKIAKKENHIHLEIPFNATNINFTIYILNILGNWKK
ncbi:hypothetical protein, partial [Clostridium tarantellae]